MPVNAPRRKHHHLRSATEKLTPLGQLIDTLLPRDERKEQARLFGIEGKLLSEVMHRTGRQSQVWLNKHLRPALSAHPMWKSKYETEFDEIIANYPATDSKLKDPAQPGTLGEVFDLSYPGKREDQAQAFGLAFSLVSRIASGKKPYSHEVMANRGFREILRAGCNDVLTQTGDDVWAEVSTKFDLIAYDRITRNGMTKKQVLLDWCAGVGEVFKRIRADVPVAEFLGPIDHDIFGEKNSKYRDDIYEKMEAGAWFSEHRMPAPDTMPMGSERVRMTRCMYLRVAENLYEHHLNNAANNPKHVELREAMLNYFPELNPTIRLKHGLRALKLEN